MSLLSLNFFLNKKKSEATSVKITYGCNYKSSFSLKNIRPCIYRSFDVMGLGNITRKIDGFKQGQILRVGGQCVGWLEDNINKVCMYG